MQEPTIYPAWKEAVKTFIESKPEPGHIISEGWKLDHFGITKPNHGTAEQFQRYSFEMLQAFEPFRRTLLEEYQVYLKPCGHGAHMVVHASEQTSDAWKKRTRAIGREIVALRKEVTNVNYAELTAEQRKENTDKQIKVAMMATMFHKSKRMSIPSNEKLEIDT